MEENDYWIWVFSLRVWYFISSEIFDPNHNFLFWETELKLTMVVPLVNGSFCYLKCPHLVLCWPWALLQNFMFSMMLIDCLKYLLTSYVSLQIEKGILSPFPDFILCTTSPYVLCLNSHYSFKIILIYLSYWSFTSLVKQRGQILLPHCRWENSFRVIKYLV